MTCDKITIPKFTKAQIEKCKTCKNISEKKKWCCLFGTSVPRKETEVRPKSKKEGCCGKKKKGLIQTVGNIVEGYKNLLMQTKEPWMLKRIDICTKCKPYHRWVRNMLWCKICNCFIPAKARVRDEHCPKGKW